MYIRKARNQIEKQAHVPLVKQNILTNIYHSISMANGFEDILTCKWLTNSK